VGKCQVNKQLFWASLSVLAVTACPCLADPVASDPSVVLSSNQVTSPDTKPAIASEDQFKPELAPESAIVPPSPLIGSSDFEPIASQLATVATPQPQLLSQALPSPQPQRSLQRLLPVSQLEGEAQPVKTSRPQNSQQQVTSVSQLSDVQPTDWAFQALQSLVERYGCIVGYPDSTFRGNRALSRYELAAGLNACITRIEELIAATTTPLATKEELLTLQKLQEEFAAELAAVRGKVDTLEARTTQLEAQQFSTTTKLSGSAIFALAGAFGSPPSDTNQVVFQERVRLLLNSSFTGRDSLTLALYAGNAFLDSNFSPFRLPGTSVFIPAARTTVNLSTPEGGLTSQTAATTNNQVKLLAVQYSFPVGKRLLVSVASGRSLFETIAPTLNPFNTGDEGTGAIGAFGRYNPLYLLVSGGTGAILNFRLSKHLNLTGGYLADGGFAADPSPGSGLFNGGYGVLSQLTWSPVKRFSVAGVFAHNYAQGGRFGFNNNAISTVGTGIANTLAGQDILGGDRLGIPQFPVVTNGYGLQFSWRQSQRFILSGWFSTVYPRLIGRGDGNILTYALTFAFPDLGKKGNLLGLVMGAEPYLTRFDGGNPQPFKTDIPWHIETFYRHQLTDRISITPGVIWLTAPNQDRDNGSALISTLRTTFQF
jgi:hypothetical protein